MKKSVKRISLFLILALVVTLIPNVSLLGVDTADAATKAYSRVYGKTRYDTSAKVLETYGKKGDIIIASGTNYPDALSGATLAAETKASVFLTAKGKESQTIKYVKKYLSSTGTVYILGGKYAVSAALEKQLKNIAPDRVVRLYGKDRYGTNLAILKEIYPKGTDKIVICSGKNYPDALSASNGQYPIMLAGDKLTSAQKSYLAKNKNAEIVVLGGKYAVSESVEKALKSYGTVKRVGGKTRYDTSKNYAYYCFQRGECKKAVAVYGDNFPDGLSGAILAIYNNGPVLLATSANYEAASEATERLGIEKGYVIGGTPLISDYAAAKIFVPAAIRWPSASNGYTALNKFRTTKNIWYWNKDDSTKTVFNTNSSNTLSALTVNDELEAAAKVRARELATEFSHTRPDGTICFTAYPGSVWGENIAYGYGLTAEGAVEMWKEEGMTYSGQGHRRNMLGEYYNAVGIAGYHVDGVNYWVMALAL